MSARPHSSPSRHIHPLRKSEDGMDMDWIYGYWVDTFWIHEYLIVPIFPHPAFPYAVVPPPIFPPPILPCLIARRPILPAVLPSAGRVLRKSYTRYRSYAHLRRAHACAPDSRPFPAP